jgi:hypothetical protein
VALKLSTLLHRMTSVPEVIEYGARVSKPKNLQEFRDQVREVHASSVDLGVSGPLILLSAFLSSTVVLMYRGVRRGAVWIERRVRRQ